MPISRSVAGFARYFEKVEPFPGQEKSTRFIKTCGVAAQTAFVNGIPGYGVGFPGPVIFNQFSRVTAGMASKAILRAGVLGRYLTVERLAVSIAAFFFEGLVHLPLRQFLGRH